MVVTAVPVSGTVQVRRGTGGPFAAAAAAASSDVIIIPVAQNAALIRFDPAGACTRGTGLASISPVINQDNSNVWVCRSSLWQSTRQTLTTFNSLAPFTP